MKLPLISRKSAAVPSAFDTSVEHVEPSVHERPMKLATTSAHRPHQEQVTEGQIEAVLENDKVSDLGDLFDTLS